MRSELFELNKLLQKKDLFAKTNSHLKVSKVTVKDLAKYARPLSG